MQEYRSNKLLRALGIAIPTAALAFTLLIGKGDYNPNIVNPSQIENQISEDNMMYTKEPSLLSVPEPENLEIYCQRTCNHITLKPGESVRIREEVDGELVDVIEFELERTVYRGEEIGNRIDLRLRDLEFPKVRYIEDDENTIYLIALTKEDEHIASYIVKILRVDPDSATIRYGPERCKYCNIDYKIKENSNY